MEAAAEHREFDATKETLPLPSKEKEWQEAANHDDMRNDRKVALIWRFILVARCCWWCSNKRLLLMFYFCGRRESGFLRASFGAFTKGQITSTFLSLGREIDTIS